VNIELLWRTPLDLIETSPSDSQDYLLDNDSARRVPEKAGIYVFARRFGTLYEPLYVGQADNLRLRINQHLKTNVALMKAMREAKSGARSILIAEIRTRQGQQVQRVLDIVERAFIAEAVRSGSSLVNRQLVAQNFHEIASTGAKASRGPFPPSLSVPIT